MLPLTGAPALVADRLNKLANVREVVRDLLTLSNQRMAARSSRPAPSFVVGDFVFLSSKGLHIHSKICKHLRDHRLGPYQVIEKVGLKSYRLRFPQDCKRHLVFHCDLFSKASTSTPLRIDLLKLKVTTMSTQSISYQMLKLIIGQIAVVSISIS